MKPLRFLTFGAGAIGTYIGGSLALAGYQLVYIEQPQVADELHQRGLRMDLKISHNKVVKLRSPAISFVNSVEQALQESPFDIAIFALKSYDTAAVLKEVEPFSRQMPPVLCLQNGVDNESAIASIVGVENVIAGTVTSSIGRRAVGDIILEKFRGVGIAGGHPLSKTVTSALNEAGLNARLLSCAADMKWSKMLTNLLTNATAAILNMNSIEILANPDLFAIEMAMLQEALDVMEAHGFHTVDLPKVPVRALSFAAHLPSFISHPLIAKAVGGGRGGKMPSFHIDLYSGRGKSEVDWLNGAVVRYAEQVGLQAPINKMLTKTLLSLSSGEIPIETYNRRSDKLLALLS